MGREVDGGRAAKNSDRGQAEAPGARSDNTAGDASGFCCFAGQAAGQDGGAAVDPLAWWTASFGLPAGPRDRSAPGLDRPSRREVLDAFFREYGRRAA